MSKNADSMIGNLVGTLTDPIIVYPGGWGKDGHLRSSLLA